MSFIIEKERSFYITSQLANYTLLGDGSKLGRDGTLVSSDGSTVFINLDESITIPTGAIETNFRVEQAAVWYTAPNISQALENNTFSYIYNEVAQPVIVIPDGLYSVESLNDVLSREFINRGQLENLVVLSSDESTQKVVITVAKYTQVDLSLYNSIRGVIGWNSQIWPLMMPVVETNKAGENVAAFNNIQAFTIRSDLTPDGIPINNSKSNLMALVTIPPNGANNQIVYSPNHPTIIESQSYRGKTINNFYVQICDQNGKVVPQSEPFVVLIVMHYKVLFSNQEVGIIDF